MSTSSPRVGTPKTADLSEYAHLSEKERMMNCYPYKGFEASLVLERAKAHKLNRKFNDTAADDAGGRRDILKELLHPSCKDVKNILIEPPFRADLGYNIILGDGFYANFDCVILDSAMVEIGKNCAMAPGVHIYTATHPLNPEFRIWDSPDCFELAAPIKIGDQCWIGGKSIICPGITIGDNVVIGAGSVVTKDIPSNVVVAGNPAKIIRYLDGAILPEGLSK